MVMNKRFSTQQICITFFIQIIMNPDGRSVVVPVMRPDRTFVSVAVEKLVEELTVVPNKLALVKMQLEKTVPFKLVFDKSVFVIFSEV
jgi:hypothetical protein